MPNRLNKPSPDTLHSAINQSLQACCEILATVMVDVEPIIFAKDLHGRAVYYNRPYNGILLAPPDAMLGKTDFELYPEPFASQYRSNDQIVMRTGTKQVFTELGQHTDGIQAYHTNKFPLSDADGAVIGIVGVCVLGTEKLDVPATHDAHLAQLSKREQTVLREIALGKTNRVIADSLGIGIKAIESYRFRLMRKLGMKDRAALIAFALRAGLLRQSG